MADDPVTPGTPVTPASPWWAKLYSPAMLSAIAMLITAVAGVVGAYTNKALKRQAEKDKK
jgi:hypothetical protein